MTKVLLNSRGFVIEVFDIESFSIYYLFYIEVKIFVREKWRHFGWVAKIFPDEKFCPTKVLLDDKVIVFPESVVTASNVRTVINFYAKILKCFPEKYFRIYSGFNL